MGSCLVNTRSACSHTHTVMALSNTNKKMKASFVGAFQMISDPIVTEQYAKLGLGAVLIDQQHGLLDERTAFECVQRLEKFPDCFPIVRVCDNSTALISRALDAGACGIIAPMINNPQEAKSLVDQCRYPPQGLRSWGPTRIPSFIGSFCLIKLTKYFRLE